MKAHGALYNMASKNPELAEAIAQAVRDVDSTLVFYALASSVQARVAKSLGLTVAEEVFADRTYQSDGSLTSRKQPNAMIIDACRVDTASASDDQRGQGRHRSG